MHCKINVRTIGWTTTLGSKPTSAVQRTAQILAARKRRDRPIAVINRLVGGRSAAFAKQPFMHFAAFWRLNRRSADKAKICFAIRNGRFLHIVFAAIKRADGSRGVAAVVRLQSQISKVPIRASNLPRRWPKPSKHWCTQGVVREYETPKSSDSGHWPDDKVAESKRGPPLMFKHNMANGCVILERVHRHVLAVARAFQTTMRHLVNQHEMRVDPGAAVAEARGR